MMDNKKILGNAVEQVLYEKYTLELSQCSDNAKCSRKHFQAMENIIEYKIKRIGAHSRRIVAAILVAAILLLVGCVTYVYREEIKGFFIEFHDDHMEIVKNDKKASIEEKYTATYVPDGFILKNEHENLVTFFCEWQNERNQKIRFFQNANVESVFDTEQSTHQKLKIYNQEIYLIENGNKHFYIWSKDGYMFRIETSYEIYQNELENIIKGIKIIKCEEKVE